MAFSFSSAGGGGFGASPTSSGAAQVQDGPELQEVSTDQIGFASINGEAKLQILGGAWDPLPPPTSSLLAIASRKGLLAAAGPDALVLASTQSVRDALRSDTTTEDGKTRTIQPQITIRQPRLGHVAFSADESVLVMSKQEGGGFIAYQVDRVEAGQIEPALQISTNNVGLRALVPNPIPESAELFAGITYNGELLLADLKAAQLRSGPNGSVLKTGVSCLSWSNRGKQLVVGLADGTATQLKPDGTVVSDIPRPPSVSSEVHVSGISWLENDTFFIIYTPNDTSEGILPSEYYIVNRELKTTNYTFQKLPEVLLPFGVERLPTFHFIGRLRNFPPHIQDLLVLTATTATDVGLVSKTDKALSNDNPVTGAFALTTINDDTRRAQLPLSAAMEDTSPIGMAFDLSSTEKVPNPIPSDPEILETEHPVPNLMILNNEGILVSSWIIYNDSVREKTSFSGFPSGGEAQQASMQTPTSPEAGNTPATTTTPFSAPTSTFGQSSYGSSTPFGKPAESILGPSTTQSSSAFANASGNTFGTPSTIGGGKSSWTSTGFGSNNALGSASTSAFGKPAFGSPAPLGGAAPAFGAPAFGSTGIPTARTPASGQPAAPPPSTFGSRGGVLGGGSIASPFAAASNKQSGFASFSQSNGFGAFGASKQDTNNESPFGKANGASIFSQPTSDSPFAPKKEGFAGFANPTTDTSKSSFGSAGGFKLGSTFQGDGTAKDDFPQPAQPSGFGFGGSFGDLLRETKSEISPTHDAEREMEDDVDDKDDASSTGTERPFTGVSLGAVTTKEPQNLVTPPSTLSQSKATPAPPVSNLFGMGQQSTTPQPPPPVTTTGWSFGNPPSTTPKDTPAPSHPSLFGTKSQLEETPAAVQNSEPVKTFADIPQPLFGAPQKQPDDPKIKEEPPSDDEKVDLKDIPEAPLPPEPVSKPRYVSGDTSASSSDSKTASNDPPLPPDFLPANRSVTETADQEELPSDEDDFSSDFEGSGEDVTGDISPVEDPGEDQSEQVQTSPESSFGRGAEKSPVASPTGGLFTKVAAEDTTQKPSRPLFGEVGAGPVFPPPKTQESPRSPSPVRHLSANDLLKADARSVSAPLHRGSAIDQRKTDFSQSSVAAQAAQTREEEARKEAARQGAATRDRAAVEAEQFEALEDNEDERIQKELGNPVQPSQELDSFITYQPDAVEESAKSGIPAQIERLYRDINSMVLTLGINARSLSAFMLYQTSQEPNASWPDVLRSETPMDALNDEWVFDDISNLHEGQEVLESMLEHSKVDGIAGKLQQCQNLLSRELFDLRTKLTAVRKTLHSRTSAEPSVIAPLSAEQFSIQHDLRKASASAQTKLVQMEDNLAVLRAKLSESGISESSGRRRSLAGRAGSQKKPTVEAVSNTITKMTAMAEKKSADVDILEAQLRKLDATLGQSVNGRHSLTESPSTPRRIRTPQSPVTPGSDDGSVYHTPDSKLASSTRSTPSTNRRAFGSSINRDMVAISNEDKERWQAKARKRKEVASALKGVLEERRSKATAAKA